MSALMSWSGGKDACMALHHLRGNGLIRVAGLLTTLVRDPDRVGVHEVGADLIRLQASALGLPLIEALMQASATNAQYEEALTDALAGPLAEGVDTMVFGDLFLEDIRAYRDGLAARLGVRPLYPNWREPTGTFARAVIDAGFKAVVCSVDTLRLPLHFAGREYDETFVAQLPADIDPCGENGEFHTFVYDGPGFARPVGLRKGDPEMCGAFGYCPLWAA